MTTDAVRQLKADLARFGYLADEGLATAIHLAVRLRRLLLLEGAPPWPPAKDVTQSPAQAAIHNRRSRLS